MKKIVAFLLFTNISVNSFSQITQSSFPVTGDTFIYQNNRINVQFSSIDQSGENHTWDYTGYGGSMFFNYQIDTIIFQPPSDYVESINFPGSDVVVSYRTTGFDDFWKKGSFLHQLNNEIVCTGILEEVNQDSNAVSMVNDPPLTLFKFPINYTNSFKDTSKVIIKLPGSLVDMPFDSVMMHRTIYRHDTVDGSGLLKLYRQSFDNTLRNKITDVYLDSMFTLTIGNSWTFLAEETKELTYVFWHRPDSFIVAAMEVKEDTVYNFLIPVPPPGSLKLEFNNVAATIAGGETMPTFEVRAIRKSDNSLAIEFNDSIFIHQLPSQIPSFSGGYAVPAVNGVATFNNTFFSLPSDYMLVAMSQPDTLDRDSVLVHVIPGPDHIQIGNLQSAHEGQLLQPFQVIMYNSLGQVDLLFNRDVSIGKLSGTGKITGTTVKTAVNGIATFDDISINHADQYNLIAWVKNTNSALASYVDSEYVTINTNPDLEWTPYETDTLSLYVDRAQFFVWTGNADGYLSGTSREWYDEIGQHFDFSQKGLLKEVIFYACSWYPVSTILNDTYKVKIYNSGVNLHQPANVFSRQVSDSLCLELLGEQTFTQDDVNQTDFFIRMPSVITFDTPVEVYSDFIVALELNNEMADDTVIIWSSIIGDGMGERRTSRRIIENYPGFSPGWIHDHDWRPEYDVDLMIMPVIDVDTADIVTGFNTSKATSIALYPNPASDIVYINAGEPIKKIIVTDLSGRVIYSYLPEIPDNRISVTTAGLATGLYTIEISFLKSGQLKEKLVILKP